jgi:HSP20 family protein
MRITRWNPVQDLVLSSVFGEPFTEGNWRPAVDIFEAPNQDLIVKAEIPAMKREDIKVTVEQNVLTIEGERKFDETVTREQYHRVERGYGAFRRSFTLPATLDASKISASYTDGVLTVTVPQRPEAQARTIDVQG